MKAMIIGAVIGVLLSWLCGALVAWDINPGNWSVWWRLWCVAWAILWGVVGTAIGGARAYGGY